MSKLKSLIFIFLSQFFTTCLPENQDVTVYLNKLSTKYIGRKGSILIRASPYDKFNKDLTRNVCFKSKISYYRKDVECGLWKHSEDDFYVFCNIGNDIPAGNYSLDFSGVQKFNYQDYNIILYSEQYSNSKFEFEKLDKDLIDLYSDRQIINITEGKDYYVLKFNVVSYNQEVLLFKTLGFVYMDCNLEENILICKIKKSDLEKGLFMNNYHLNTYYVDVASPNVLIKLPFVGYITIIDNIAQKTDVFVGITRLLVNVTEGNSYIAYETNITNINNIISVFKLNFTNEFGKIEEVGCYIKKYEDNPLLITCSPPNIGKFWLKEIKKEIIINDTNIRYNFRIQPVKNEERIYHSGKDKGSWIVWLYPEILDFSNKDTL